MTKNSVMSLASEIAVLEGLVQGKRQQLAHGCRTFGLILELCCGCNHIAERDVDVVGGFLQLRVNPEGHRVSLPLDLLDPGCEPAMLLALTSQLSGFLSDADLARAVEIRDCSAIATELYRLARPEQQRVFPAWLKSLSGQRR